MNFKRTGIPIIFIFMGIIIFLIAITIWWLSLANPDLLLLSILLIFISILLIVTSIISFIFNLSRRLEKLELIYRIKEIESDTPFKNLDIKIVSLNNWEKRIINALKENQGELTQAELKNLTGLSRSNLSKHVRSLEMKKIIHKEPHQKTNKIILLKNFID